MSDVPVAPSVAPTVAAPVAPAVSVEPPGEVAPSAGQVRGPDGKFVSPSPKPAESPAQKARRLQVTAADKTYDFDLDNDEDLQRLRDAAEFGIPGKRRFTELDRKEKEFQARLAKFKDDPEARLAMFKDSGVDPRAWAEDLIIRHAEESSLTPEQKRAKELDAREAKLKSDETERATQAQQAEVARHKEETWKMLSEVVPSAIEAAGLGEAGKVPPKVLESLTANLREMAAAGKPLTPESIQRAAKAVREEATEMFASVAKGLTGKRLVGVLGPDVVKELRRYDLEQWDAGRKTQAAPPTERVEIPRPAKKMISERELRDILKGK